MSLPNCNRPRFSIAGDELLCSQTHVSAIHMLPAARAVLLDKLMELMF